MPEGKQNKIVVHMIGNAHLDPVWLWRREDGVGEALATCRTACDLLDEYPQLRITRGEAWVYWQIRKIDHGLFRRIAAHVKAGRWCVVNGWWIQPDCNLPVAESFVRQSQIGARFFQKNFGIDVTVGYNVDSFGHCAMLPTFLKQGGKDAYVFMRPNPGEMTLPSNLFRWRSPAGDEVLTFRLASYAAVSVHGLKNGIERELAQASPGAAHTMCMYGIGDHGGGPTRRQIEWILEHRDYAPGVKLRFSDPRSFFDAVKADTAKLPVYEGELQYHAVGCYSVVRQQKREMRRAENLLLQAERLISGKDRMPPQLEEIWRTLLFNQFHDILCGSSIESAHVESYDELGAVKTFARDALVTAAMRRNAKLPPCERQRVVVDNFSGRTWRGLVGYEPWLEIGAGQMRGFRLIDEAGALVPVQFIRSVAASNQMSRALFRVELAPGERKVFELRRQSKDGGVQHSALSRSADGTFDNGALAVRCGARGVESLRLNGRELLGRDGIRIVMIADPTDTWSHGVAGFGVDEVAEFKANQSWTVTEDGPLRQEFFNEFSASDSALRWSVMLDRGENVLRLKLSMNWRERHKVAKLCVPAGFAVKTRRDGTPGAFLSRPLDGREYPVIDLVSLEGKDGCLTTVSPDVFSADVQPDGTARLTLLRSPVYAHEGDYVLPAIPVHNATDQGEHVFEIALVLSDRFDGEALLDEAACLSQPPLLTETTLGMPAGWVYESVPRFDGIGIPRPNEGAWLPEELLTCTDFRAVTLVKSESLCKKWRGVRLLTSTEESLTFRLPAHGNERCKLDVAALAGGRFGTLAVMFAGEEIGRIIGNGGPVLAELPVGVCGDFEVEIVREGGDRTALGFLSLVPSYVDIGVQDWRVCGPYLFAGDCTPVDAISSIIHAPEQKTLGATAKWRPAKASISKDYLDFHAFSGKLAGSIHYARTYLRSPRPQTVVLSYGCDYWYRFWLNGEVIVDCADGQGAPRKRKFALTVPLHEGWNELLVKIVSGSTGNGFWMSVSDYEGLALSPQEE